MLSSGDTCRIGDHLIGDVVADGDTLVQQRKCVTHSTVCQPRNQRSCVRMQVNAFLTGDERKSRFNIRRTNPAEVVLLAPGNDCCRDLVQFGCCENKDDMGRRFFHNLEQRIECTDREHVHLIDDINPVFADSRSKICLIPQNADIIDAVVGRRVHFGDVKY